MFKHLFQNIALNWQLELNIQCTLKETRQNFKLTCTSHSFLKIISENILGQRYIWLTEIQLNGDAILLSTGRVEVVGITIWDVGLKSEILLRIFEYTLSAKTFKRHTVYGEQ